MEQKGKKSRLGKGLSELLGEARAQEAIIQTAMEDIAADFPTEDFAAPDENISPTTQHAAKEQAAAFHQAAAGASPEPLPLGETVYMLSVDKIEPNPVQPRKEFDSTNLQSLADSLKEYGMLQPLIVTRKVLDPDLFMIVAGERRWRAAQLANMQNVPIIIRDLTDARLLQVALIENLQREDLSALEEAECYRYLMTKYNMTQNEIAMTIGKSRSYVANIMRMLRLDSYVKALLSGGDISVGHAKILASLPSDESKYYAEETVKKGLNVRALEKRINGTSSNNTAKFEAIPKQKDEDTLALEADLISALGMPVNIQSQKSGRGSMTISFDNLKQLNDICKKLCVK